MRGRIHDKSDEIELRQKPARRRTGSQCHSWGSLDNRMQEGCSIIRAALAPRSRRFRCALVGSLRPCVYAPLFLIPKKYLPARLGTTRTEAPYRTYLHTHFEFGSHMQPSRASLRHRICDLAFLAVSWGQWHHAHHGPSWKLKSHN